MSARDAAARRRWGLLAGLVLLAALMLASVCIGSRALAPALTWQALVAFDPADSRHLLVRGLRLPRTVLAVLVGAALGAAGTLMQALSRNPLAEPGVLGVNAGAATAIVLATALLGNPGTGATLLAALAGAALAGAAVHLLGASGRGLDPMRLVLAGAALSSVLLALAQLVLLNSDDAVFDHYRHWVVGSLQGRGAAVVWPTALLVATGVAMAAASVRALDALALGRDLGRALGADPARVWGLAVLAVVVLAAAATAAAGPIGFVGLAAPHLARAAAGAGHRWALPYAMLFAAILLLGADCLGRLLAWPAEVDVGIMAALIGGPFFVALALRRRLLPA
ncbi:iron ABC transporter permease [Xanthomonas campestris pv. phormiicola]|nr:iron ABC transporter permease [Xanthomonas campestris pv. phormiicola]UYC14623.1 iron ABC transporter permease [Xanthomonas campestris pv. phormiicola]